jgi:hypothetical protein
VVVDARDGFEIGRRGRSDRDPRADHTLIVPADEAVVVTPALRSARVSGVDRRVRSREPGPRTRIHAPDNESTAGLHSDVSTSVGSLAEGGPTSNERRPSRHLPGPTRAASGW